MKILVVNGPNLNLLGKREPDIYGKTTYKELIKTIKQKAKELKIKVKFFQSNYEGKIITKIQKSKCYDGLIINAGGLTHTSICILDAIKAVNIPTVEVHLSDINNREEFRKSSYISLIAKKSIIGKGIQGYIDALKFFNK